MAGCVFMQASCDSLAGYRVQAWPHEHEFADAAVLAAELKALAKASGAPENVLPSARMLKDAGRHDLLQVGIDNPLLMLF